MPTLDTMHCQHWATLGATGFSCAVSGNEAPRRTREKTSGTQGNIGLKFLQTPVI